MALPGRWAKDWQNLTLEQRLSVGVLCVAGLASVVFGLVQLRTALIQPFTTDVQQLVDLKKALGPTEQELVDQQKRTDTDGDGISDYDELNAYHTSSYLRDSDSDGMPDNIEIAKGTDPNCAEGKTCVGVLSGTAAPTGTAVGIGTLPIPDYSAFPGGANGSAPSAIPDRSPAAIRAYLRASGVSEGDLAGYTDEELLNAYDESRSALDQQPQNASSTAPAF